MKLASPPPLVRDALQTAGLLELFEIAPTVKERSGRSLGQRVQVGPAWRSSSVKRRLSSSGIGTFS